MSKTTKKTPDRLMDDASTALVETRYFDAEALALEALHLAHGAHDFERMARICMPLLEARRQKRLAAIDSGNFVRLGSVDDVPEAIEPGCYLFEPMLVAADARNFRDQADRDGVPVFVLAREPETQLKEWPVAMIGPVTLRTRVERPDGGEPTLEWMQNATEELGDSALETIDPEDGAPSRVQEIIEMLGAMPDNERLHQALEAACKDAAQADG